MAAHRPQPIFSFGNTTKARDYHRELVDLRNHYSENEFEILVLLCEGGYKCYSWIVVRRYSSLDKKKSVIVGHGVSIGYVTLPSFHEFSGSHWRYIFIVRKNFSSLVPSVKEEEGAHHERGTMTNAMKYINEDSQKYTSRTHERGTWCLWGKMNFYISF